MIRPLNQFLPKGHRNPKGVIKYLSEIDGLNSSLENVPGAYVFFSRKQNFIYPNGQSRIIYIGESIRLRSRIKVHQKVYNDLANIPKYKRTEHWRYSRYYYMLKFDAGFAWFTTRGKQTSKNLERDLLEYFYDRYHALPVGNGAYSY